ncbi:MAG TPA: M28 family peptidase [Symbiobacteriaceae bacterium]|nr:M28 family peptidase [Symbiobacteriaceae bacterium]
MRRILPWLFSLAALTAALGLASLSIRAGPLYAQDLHVTRSQIRFDGERALWWTTRFVEQFPHRHAGGPNSGAAAFWLAEQLQNMGYDVAVHSWTAPLYGRPTKLRNVVARRPGPPGAAAVLLEAHHDQAPTTVQGADNDGSGVGILLHMAELLAGEELAQPVVFLFADAEEYGMVGVRQFVSREPGPFLAALTVDNAGKASAFGTDVELLGQGRGYTPLGLFRLLQDLAHVAGGWPPYPQDPAWQIISRSVLISFTDQGPLLRSGIPAMGVGATGLWPHYHTPEDTLDKLSAETMGRMGRLTEAFIREMQYRPDLRQGGSVYLFLGEPRPAAGDPGRYVPGWSIRLVQLSLLLPFLLAAWQAFRAVRPPEPTWGRGLLWLGGMGAGLLRLLPGALPLLAGLVVLPLLVRLGLIPGFAFYPPPPRDPALLDVAWPGVIGFGLAVAAGVWAGTRLSRRLPPAPRAYRRAAALAVLAVLALAVWVRNGYALLFLVPALYAWPLMGRRLWANLPLLLAGAAPLAGLLWLFAERILHIGPYMLWYFLQMVAYGVVAPYTVLTAALVLGCGLALALPDGVDHALDLVHEVDR